MTIADKLLTIAENEQRVYEAGYQKGAEENTGIDPTWTDWQYFSYNNSRNNLVEKLKYTDTSNGTNFAGMFSHCSSLTTIPEIDTGNGTSFNQMFLGCSSLTAIPEIDTGNGTNFNQMFYEAYSLRTIPEIDTSNGTSFNMMFYDCSSLTAIPEIDTGNGTNFSYIFYLCSSLTTIPKLNLSNATSVSSMFTGCSKLVEIGLEGTIGITGIRLSDCVLLNHKTLMKFINALVDYSSSTTTRKLTLGTTNLAKLTNEEKAIATEKGWTLS